MDTDLAGHLRRLEEVLLRPEVRRDRAALEGLLARDFVEFGSSGRTHDRRGIVESLAGEEPADVRIEDLAVRLLAGDVALVTCRSVRDDPAGGPAAIALRSSVWRRGDDGAWRLTFHQGTPTR